MIFYGASGHAKVVIEAWVAAGGIVTAVFDDNESITQLLKYPVNGKFKPVKDTLCMISVGANKVRKEIVETISAQYGKVIHPHASISPSSDLGAGTVVMARGVINADTTLGRHVIINTAASVDHDCNVQDFVHIAPGAVLCGNVHVGEGTLVGAGAVIIPGIKIGKWCIIGAGAVVVKNVPDNSVVAGNPARVINLKS
jgi:sugar O-acyltransferase (sialic acid O-acetyltransferase NeuD family)